MDRINADLQTFGTCIQTAREVIVVEVVVLIELPASSEDRGQVNCNEQAVDHHSLRGVGPKEVQKTWPVLEK